MVYCLHTIDFLMVHYDIMFRSPDSATMLMSPILYQDVRTQPKLNQNFEISKMLHATRPDKHGLVLCKNTWPCITGPRKISFFVQEISEVSVNKNLKLTLFFTIVYVLVCSYHSSLIYKRTMVQIFDIGL